MEIRRQRKAVGVILKEWESEDDHKYFEAPLLKYEGPPLSVLVVVAK